MRPEQCRVHGLGRGGARETSGGAGGGDPQRHWHRRSRAPAKVDPRMRIEGRGLLSSTAAVLIVAGCGLARARPAAAAASPWTSNPQSQVRLISGDRVAPRHGELRLGVQFRLAPGWHAYWKNSGDAGFAPVVTFAPRPGLTPPELLWPAPHRFELPGGLQAFGYASEVVYPARAALD